MSENFRMHEVRECVEQYATAEPVMRDHRCAMRCLDLEDKIRRGLRLFDLIKRIDAMVADDILSGECEKDEAGKARMFVESLFRNWLRPCDAVSTEAKKLKKDGYEVEGAERFALACAEARWCLDDDAIDSDGPFADLIDAALSERRE